MKGKVKRILSGMLSVMTILTSVVQPVTAYAAEPEPAAYEAEYPALQEVRDKLAEDEIVTAQDYEVEAGSGFDVKSDFSSMEINREKVKVTFHEAKNEAGQDFDGNRADSYKAVYFVEPVSGNPRYHVIRHVVVKEPVKEAGAKRTASPGEQGEKGHSEALGMDEEQSVADLPRKSTNLAGRISAASRIADAPQKRSVLSKLKEKQGQVTLGQGRQMLAKKKEQEL